MNNNTTNQTVKKSTYTSSTFLIIICVLSLIFIIIYMYNSYKSTMLLATTATVAYSMCPNYWDSIGKGKCQNTKMLGTCSNTSGGNIMDFSSDIFTNPNTGNYAKCKWANTCNVSWSNIDRIC
jgi:hypothetical protein